MKQSNSKRKVALVPAESPVAANPPLKAQPSKESRNKANTIRNSVKVEHFLMEVEKVHGFAKSWAMRERLEQGQVSLEELQRR